jgi:cell division protein FtsL
MILGILGMNEIIILLLLVVFIVVPVFIIYKVLKYVKNKQRIQELDIQLKEKQLNS